MTFKKLLIGALVLAVFLLHQDCWNWGKIGPLVFGCLPAGLAYHAGYTILAAITMALLVKFAWPNQLGEIEQREARTAQGSETPEVKPH